MSKKPELQLEDVADALKRMGVSADATNAKAVRDFLGITGSPNTYQKHLNALRATAAEASKIGQVDELPEMPEAEMQALWQLAAAAAMSRSFERLVTLQQERDVALKQIEVCAADLAAAQDESSGLIDELDAAKEAISAAAAAAAEKDAAVAAKDAQIAVMERASELAAAENRAQISVLEALNSRQNDDLAELKSLLQGLQKNQAEAAEKFAAQLQSALAESAALRSQLDAIAKAQADANNAQRVAKGGHKQDGLV